MKQRCGNPAAFKFVWPGQDGFQFICSDHLPMLRAVARALGMVLTVWTVTPEEFKENTCPQEIDKPVEN